MPTPFSVRSPLQGCLLDFLTSSGFESVAVTELARDMVCLLANYREEDVPVYPSVFILPSPESVAALSPGTRRLVIGRASLASAAEAILKRCATLATNGWAIYVAPLADGQSAEYGVFRSAIHSFAIPTEELMVAPAAAEMTPAVLIRNRGQLIVELINSANEIQTVSFTAGPQTDSSFGNHIAEFCSAAVAGVHPEDRQNFHAYLARLLTDTLQNSHGALLAVISSPEDARAPEELKDGVWLEHPIGLFEAHTSASSANDAQSLANLQGFESLVRGMINCDGVVVFGNDGCVLGFRVFLAPTEDETRVLPSSGGGRRRTFELMKTRLGITMKAALFRSHDGGSDCARSPDE